MGAFRGRLAFCSNFFPAEVFIRLIPNGRKESCPTTEHAFQALKTNNPASRFTIIQASTPGAAKRLGKQVELRPDWEEKKVMFMENLLRQKFSIPKLASMLLATGDENLIEENEWHDQFWGSCTCAQCGNKGANMLGKLLMKIRAELAQKDSK
jgi:ribA/ribD-fused uncharacterized protein